MRRRLKGYNRILAVAIVAAMALATPAFAEPVPSSGLGTATPVPAPPPTDTADTPDTLGPSQPTTESAVPVEVDPETEEFRRRLAEKQAEIDAFKAQLDELDRQLAISVESYNASVEELDRTKDLLATTEEDLIAAREAYEVQLALLNDRVRLMYLQGDMNALELLLDAKSVNDFVDRVVFLTTMGSRDTEIVGQLANQRTSIEQDLLDIENAQLQAEALEFELKARQIEVTLRIQERQEMLASTQVELLELLDEEAARRALEQQELFEAIMSGAGDVGISITPGTPVETAFAYHGIPYLWGGETPAGFDCSGLVLYVFKQHGVELPHYSGSQFLLGTRVAPADLKPGDVLFFGSPIHHVGIYVGAGYFIHAPRTGDFVKVSPLIERTDFAGARRYDWQPRVGPPLGVTLEPTPETASTTAVE